MLEQLREHPLHDLAVLEHVRNARGHAQIVLEDVDGTVDVANQIGAADVRPHAVRRIDADACLAEILGVTIDFLGNDAVVMICRS